MNLKARIRKLFTNVWTVPNVLTMLRLVLVPVFVVLFLKGYKMASLAVFAVASLTDMLEYLRSRMQVKKSFPHEVGLFLGYPPADVRGFIENRGQDFACAGYWKVYSNEKEARKLFRRYSECSHAFCTSLEQGKAFQDLVCAC